MNKEELLEYITDHYLISTDFNGVPSYNMPLFDVADLVELIAEDCVRILADDDDDINMHINRCDCFAEKSEQIKTVQRERSYAVYPTPKHLATLDIREEKPFTEMLARGAEQFRILYFSVDVLELYVNNPQYTIWDYGYRGSICVQDWDTAQEDALHSEYIKDFGVAYPCEEPHDRDRAIAVFLRDLSKLNYEAQCKWRGFLLRNQTEFRVNGGFIRNLMYGDWSTGYWIFDAVLDEIKVINAMCRSIGLPQLFCKEYSREQQELIGYRIILIPSLKNYYEFVSALEKIVVNNLNYDTFQKVAPHIKPIERRKEEGSLKGSIEMLEEWFSVNYFSINPYGDEMFRKSISHAFRTIRKIRQIPAHMLYDNKHDKTVYKQQNELIAAVYYALKDLRMMFSRHPRASAVVVPDELQDEANIVIY